MVYLKVDHNKTKTEFLVMSLLKTRTHSRVAKKETKKTHQGSTRNSLEEYRYMGKHESTPETFI